MAVCAPVGAVNVRETSRQSRVPSPASAWRFSNWGLSPFTCTYHPTAPFTVSVRTQPRSSYVRPGTTGISACCHCTHAGSVEASTSTHTARPPPRPARGASTARWVESVMAALQPAGASIPSSKPPLWKPGRRNSAGAQAWRLPAYTKNSAVPPAGQVAGSTSRSPVARSADRFATPRPSVTSCSNSRPSASHTRRASTGSPASASSGTPTGSPSTPAAAPLVTVTGIRTVQ